MEGVHYGDHDDSRCLREQTEKQFLSKVGISFFSSPRNAGSTVSREIGAGLTTFAAMAYILAVNPAILKDAGMDAAALVTATALSAAIGTLLMALFTNYPVALAPGMGLNALFTYEICLGLGVPWQAALGMVFWNGILFLALTVTGLRTAIVKAIPENLKTGLQVGIGLLIAFVGLKGAGIVVASEATLMTLGPLSAGLMPNAATLALGGLVFCAVLMARKTPGAILVAILVVAAIGLFVPGEDGGAITPVPEKVVAPPASLQSLWLQADLLYPLKNWQISLTPVLTLMFVDMFDSIGTLIGVSRRAGLCDAEGNLPRMGTALSANAAATSIGALLGTSPVTSYVESAAGVEAGGRTGLTGVVVAGCFLASLFFHPLILCIPAAATAPALVIVGILMMSGLKGFDWTDIKSAVPAVATMILIPLGFGIANGIAIGCILQVAVRCLAGEWRSVHWLLAVLAALFVLKFAVAGG